MVYDWNCDGNYWRTCSGSMRTPSKNGSCTWVKNTGINYSFDPSLKMYIKLNKLKKSHYTFLFLGACVDSALQWVQNIFSMDRAGWKINVETDLSKHSRPNACSNFKGNFGSTFRGYKHGSTSNGTLTTKFKGSGRASLDFGNCGIFSRSVIDVFLNDNWVGSANATENSTEINFYYESQDELKIFSNTNNEIMIINSLELLCNGNTISTYEYILVTFNYKIYSKLVLSTSYLKILI